MKTAQARNTVALYSMLLTGAANGLLTAIFFFLAIGSLSNVFGVEIGLALNISISLFLGAGLVLGEFLVHTEKEEKISRKIILNSILIILALINWGAGYYRNQDALANNRISAISIASKDARYTSLLKDKEDIKRDMLNDGDASNDEKAEKSLERIEASLSGIVGEYKQESTGSKSSNTSRAIVSLAFIVITIIFGKASKTWANANATTARTRTNANATRRTQPVNALNAPETQPAFGFHSQPETQAMPRPVAQNGMITDEKKDEIEDAYRRAHELGLTYRNAPSNRAIARHCAVSEATVRKVKVERDIA